MPCKKRDCHDTQPVGARSHLALLEGGPAGLIDESVAASLTLDSAVNAKIAFGGTSRDNVAAALAAAHEYLNDQN